MADTRVQVVPGPALRALTAVVVEGPSAGRTAQGDESVTIGTANGNDLVVVDPAVSGFHVELGRDRRGVRIVDQGSTNGTWAGAIRIARGVVPAGTTLRLGDTIIRVGESEDSRPRVELLAGEQLGDLRGRSPVMRQLMAQIARLAPLDVSVVIHGESGTGKELVARALHRLSPRADRPLVTVDCGSLAPTLVASELFGHERGAFTGAAEARAGAFEQAHGGTLFLDEIGELSESLQAVLLGVLERRRFRRLGGSRELEVDVRVVCATHRELRHEINAHRFRLDLYYRLAAVTMRLPALRDRREDIPMLAEHFLRECGWDQPTDQLLSPDVLRLLDHHDFPGNVRELRNFVEAAVAMGSAPMLEPPLASSGEGPVVRHDLPYKDARAQWIESFEREYLGKLLDRTGGNASAAARHACMTRSHLLDLLARHGLRSAPR